MSPGLIGTTVARCRARGPLAPRSLYAIDRASLRNGALALLFHVERARGSVALARDCNVSQTGLVFNTARLLARSPIGPIARDAIDGTRSSGACNLFLGARTRYATVCNITRNTSLACANTATAGSVAARQWAERSHQAINGAVFCCAQVSVDQVGACGTAGGSMLHYDALSTLHARATRR